MNDYYVYAYFEPDSLEPFYIGKGRGPRYYAHFNACLTKSNRFYNKLKLMLKNGILPRVEKLVHSLTEQQAFAIEIQLIAKYGRLDLNNGCLCNHTNGGPDGGGHVLSISERLKVAMPAPVKTLADRQANRLRGIEQSGKPIEGIHPTTKEVVYTFACLRDVKTKGFDRGSIRKVLRGQRPFAHGFIWRYSV